MMAIGSLMLRPVHSPNTFWYSVFTSKTTTCCPCSFTFGRGFERISPPKRYFVSAGSSITAYVIACESGVPGGRSNGTIRYPGSVGLYATPPFFAAS